MRNLNAIRETQRSMDTDELAELVASFTIQEKIAFSPHLSKERIREKLISLDKQVAKRTVLRNMSDEDVKFYWLQNFIHPDLKHWVYPSPKSKLGCSEKVIKRDMRIDFIHAYENGQHHYNYTMEDIEEYLNEPL